MTNADLQPTARNSWPHSGFHAILSRILELTDELSAGCDPEFDAARDDLEREFAELRLLNPASDMR